MAIRGERKESDSTSIGPNLRERAANGPDWLAKNGPVCSCSVLAQLGNGRRGEAPAARGDERRPFLGEAIKGRVAEARAVRDSACRLRRTLGGAPAREDRKGVGLGAAPRNHGARRCRYSAHTQLGDFQRSLAGLFYNRAHQHRRS